MRGRLFFGIAVLILISLVLVASAQRQTGRVMVANDFPGQDLGAKVNAADKALGARPGEIVVRNGGTISTQVILSSDHVLRLSRGTYVTKTQNIPY